MSKATPEMVEAALAYWNDCEGMSETNKYYQQQIEDTINAALAASPPTAVEPVAVPAIGDNHPDALAVDKFAAAMKAKLAQKRAEGFGGWNDPEQCHIDYLKHLLCEQIQARAVLDPIDIGNFAMMLHNRPEKSSHGR